MSWSSTSRSYGGYNPYSDDSEDQDPDPDGIGSDYGQEMFGLLESFRYDEATEDRLKELLAEERVRPGGPRPIPKKSKSGNITLMHYHVEHCSCVAILDEMLQTYPSAVSEADDSGRLPIHAYFDALDYLPHWPVIDKLIDAYPESLEQRGGMESETPLLKMIEARRGNDDWHEGVERMLDKCPRAAGLARKDGCYPLHRVCFDAEEDYHHGIVVKVLNAFPRAAQSVDSKGNYPLHLRLLRLNDPIESIVAFLCGQFPEAAHRENGDGKTPLDIYCDGGHSSNVTFWLEASVSLEETYSDFGSLDDEATKHRAADNSSLNAKWALQARRCEPKSDLTVVVIPEETKLSLHRRQRRKSYYCHSEILSSEKRQQSANYFAVLLSSPFREGQSSRVALRLHPHAARHFSDVLDYIYYGTLDMTSENVIPLMHMFCYLRCKAGYDKCIKYLHRTLCWEREEKCLLLLRDAVIFGLDKAQRAILKTCERYEHLIDLSVFNAYSPDMFAAIMTSPQIQSSSMNSKWVSRCVAGFLRCTLKRVTWECLVSLTSEATLATIDSGAAVFFLRLLVQRRPSSKRATTGMKVDKSILKRCLAGLPWNDYQAINTVKIAVTDPGITTCAALRLLKGLERA